jgi:hypothetical protein
MRVADLPKTKPVGVAPANQEALLALLRVAFPEYSGQQFNFVGCGSEKKAPCLMFTEESFVDNLQLYPPIPTLEKMAQQLMRNTIQMNYSRKRDRAVNGWMLAVVENINGLGFLAYPVREGEQQIST